MGGVVTITIAICVRRFVLMARMVMSIHCRIHDSLRYVADRRLQERA
jgi:hypothetical protein